MAIDKYLVSKVLDRIFLYHEVRGRVGKYISITNEVLSSSDEAFNHFLENEYDCRHYYLPYEERGKEICTGASIGTIIKFSIEEGIITKLAPNNRKFKYLLSEKCPIDICEKIVKNIYQSKSKIKKCKGYILRGTDMVYCSVNMLVKLGVNISENEELINKLITKRT